jgi:hypothetical protein
MLQLTAIHLTASYDISSRSICLITPSPRAVRLLFSVSSTSDPPLDLEQDD